MQLQAVKYKQIGFEEKSKLFGSSQLTVTSTYSGFVDSVCRKIVGRNNNMDKP